MTELVGPGGEIKTVDSACGDLRLAIEGENSN